MTCRCLYRLEPSHHWVTIASSGFEVQPMNSRIFTCRVFLELKAKQLTDPKLFFFHKTISKRRHQVNPPKWTPAIVKVYQTKDDLYYLKTATSFLKACSWAGVGSLTFNFFTATGPCHFPLNTVPNEPVPIRGPTAMASQGISQSSLESRRGRCYKTFVLLS